MFCDSTPNDDNGRMGLAQNFLHALVRKKWVWGACDEVTVIFFSQEDNIVRVYRSST